MKKINIGDFDAVAFDVEGTLADTIPLHHQTRIAAFNEHGYGHITPEQQQLGPTYGSSHYDVIGGILFEADEIDGNLPYHQNQHVLDIIATKKKLFKGGAVKGFEAMPGAIEFVSRIARYFVNTMALVTSSEEEFVYPFVERYKLGDYFPVRRIIGHETVIAEGLDVKPAGDPYMLAGRRMHAKHMLVFEDTVSGVVAGKKAGATVIALGFDKQNTLLFQGNTLDYPPDALVNSYHDAALLLGLDK